MRRVINLVVIVSRVYCYARKAENLTTEFVIHIVTDSGTHDTVIMKLVDRMMTQFSATYSLECAYGLEKFAFLHTGQEYEIPEKAQLIYARDSVGAGSSL